VSDALDLAARALASRDRSRQEIDRRLERAGFAADERGEAVVVLERLGYVDDRRFAAARAASLAQRGYGDEWIRSDLAERGIEREALDEAVAGLLPETERAAGIVRREGAGPRLAARLQRKGFGADAVEAAAGAAFADGDEPA
jgi:regulatory protein